MKIIEPGLNKDKLQILMEEKHIDLLMVSTRHNLRYLTGGYYYPLYAWDSHTKETQYLSFLGMPASNMNFSFFVGRPGEIDVLKEMDVWVTECYETHTIGTKPAAEKVVELLKSKNLNKSRIGFELSSLPADAYEVLKDGLPDVSFIEISGLLDTLRAVKTDREIEIIRKGTLLNQEAVDFVLRHQSPGVSTAVIAEDVEKNFRSRGLHYLYSLVCAGPSMFRAASPKKTWEDGQILHIDAGALTRGYVVEICRTAHLGTLSESAQKMLSACIDLEKHVLSRIKSGLTASKLQTDADNFLLNHPLGSSGKFVAHGIGMVHHEKPVINAQSPEVLEAGMVISIEMEFKDAEVGHVKREDMVIITDNGCEMIGK